MTSLRTRLLKALEIPNQELYGDRDNDLFCKGEQHESDRLKPIHLALADVVEASERLCTLGVNSSRTVKIIDALARLEDRLKEMGK